jgi:hypothetical protein
VRRRGYGSLYGNETERDLLKDTASHLLVASTHSKKGESVGHQDDSTSCTTEVLLPEAVSG